MTQASLGYAYADRIGGARADNLERAIAHCTEALQVYTREPFPENWANVQNNLGIAYWKCTRGERADNIERAIHHYQEALKVWTREDFPEDWAMTQDNLGMAYADRIGGERADNLERAIAHCTEALQVYTREAFPGDWAMTKNDLGLAYSDRIRGDRADNLERAIEHCAEALQVYTREAFPAMHRRLQETLGGLFSKYENWARAHAAFAAAIEAGTDLLSAAYTETGRRMEIGESARLYADDAFALLRLERPGDALERLEQGKTRLLSEALALAALDFTMLPEGDQKALRSARQAVREFEAEMRLPADTPARRSGRELAKALRQARADLDSIIASIRAGQPEFMPTGLDLPELLAVIPDGGALVAPFFTAKGSAVFVLPHGSTTVTKGHVIDLERFTTTNVRALMHGAGNEPELGG